MATRMNHFAAFVRGAACMSSADDEAVTHGATSAQMLAGTDGSLSSSVENRRIKNDEDEDETVWYASPRGDGGAASVVAALRAAGEAARYHSRTTTVQLGSGRYQLLEPLVLPSGVALRGAKSGGTVLSGGVTITGWSPDAEARRPWLWRAALPSPLRGAFREFSNGPRKEGERL